MGYLVLARKYRPQQFDEIVGQDHVTQTLRNAFAKDRVHHAFLFCGPRGVGKTTAARVLARALCCEKGPTAQPCGECSACQSILAGTAVDYFEIDGASNNSVDDVRELREGVKYQPAQLRRKVYVIDEVHMLSGPAFNALLKTLEEPPPHVTFVFATTEVHKIPVTILSRCQRYDFKLVQHAQLVAHLQSVIKSESLQLDAQAADLLARESGGSVRDMLSLADQVIAYAGDDAITEAKAADVLGVADRALLRDLTQAVLRCDASSAMLCVDAAAERGVDLAHLARAFLNRLRDLAVIRSVRDAAGLIEGNADDLASLAKLAVSVSQPQLLALFDRFARACEDLARSRTPRAVLEIALLDMTGREPLLPITELVDRLQALENSLSSRAPSVRPPSALPSGPSGSQHAATLPSAAPASATPASAAPASAAAPPAAGAAQAAASTRLPPLDPLLEWEKMIIALESRSITLAGAFARAKLLAWDDSGLVLGIPKESPQVTALAQSNALKLQDFVSEQCGAAVAIRLKAVSGLGSATEQKSSSVADVENERAQKDRAAKEQEARAHPGTQAVLAAFGTEIKEIKIDG